MGTLSNEAIWDFVNFSAPGELYLTYDRGLTGVDGDWALAPG